MENLPSALEAMPQLAPGLILGAVLGSLWGLYEDHKADDGVPHRWWQAGGLGTLIGGAIWLIFVVS